MTTFDESRDIEFMLEALKEARMALDEGEVPIGAVAVRDGKVIARGHNRRRALNDITAHAEMQCLREFDPNSNGLYLEGVTIYSTLEPCSMCSGAMIHYGCSRVVYGAKDLKLGASGSRYNFLEDAGIDVSSGVLDEECREILYGFFKTEIGMPSKAWEDIELE